MFFENPTSLCTVHVIYLWRLLSDDVLDVLDSLDTLDIFDLLKILDIADILKCGVPRPGEQGQQLSWVDGQDCRYHMYYVPYHF
jgi:hypothetical protein